MGYRSVPVPYKQGAKLGLSRGEIITANRVILDGLSLPWFSQYAQQCKNSKARQNYV